MINWVAYTEQDGPSLESSSYFNMTLRYFGLWDPGTLKPPDPGTFGLLDFHFFTSFLFHHLLILLPTSFLLVWFGMVWYGGGLSDDL